jgi:hypothetical protein
MAASPSSNSNACAITASEGVDVFKTGKGIMLPVTLVVLFAGDTVPY